MWKVIAILSKIIRTIISNTTIPTKVSLKDIQTNSIIKNKEVFIINKNIFSGLDVYNYNLKLYNLSDVDATINPYYISRSNFTAVANKDFPLPLNGGTRELSLNYTFDYISSILISSDAYSDNFNYGYTAELYVNDEFIGNIITENGLHIRSNQQDLKGSFSGILVSSDFMFIQTEVNDKVKVTVKNPRFYGGLHRDGTLYFTINLSRISDDSTTRKPCDVDVFVFGSI